MYHNLECRLKDMIEPVTFVEVLEIMILKYECIKLYEDNYHFIEDPFYHLAHHA